MTEPAAGPLLWGQRDDEAFGYNANDDRIAVTALAGYGRYGLVRAPSFAGSTTTSATLGPWLGLANCGDNTTAALGSRVQQQVTITGTTTTVTRWLFADMDLNHGTWTVTVLATAPASNRPGVLLGTVSVPANASNTNAMTFIPATLSGLGAQGMIARYTVPDNTRRNALSYNGAASVCHVQARIERGRQYQIRGGTPGMKQDTSGALRTFHARLGMNGSPIGREVRVGRLAYEDIHPVTCEYVGDWDSTANRTFDVRFWLGSAGHFIPGEGGHRLWITVEDVGPAPG